MIKQMSLRQLERIRRRLHVLYGPQAEALAERFFHMVGRYGVGMDKTLPKRPRWDQNDVYLITYADMVQAEGEAPLQTLRRFCSEYLRGAVNTVHLLPFYPWSSDDGFSVIDYRQVQADYGTWADIEQLGRDFGLMFDFVLNHCSAKSAWFRDFLTGIAPARWYFLQMDPETDLAEVVRPRTSPLLTKSRTRDGEAHVWTTFSEDQVDLNWQNPDVLFEFIDILFLYLSKGARVLRLDAVAFLWKEIGTNCIHLPQTHEVVKLFNDICETVAPNTIIITETNVPHEENVSYFGELDEAHMVYNFSLPPLLLHALLTANSAFLTKWASTLAYPGEGCTYFNFTASHDGVGVRPVQGILPEAELQTLVKAVRERDGYVSMRAMPDGSESPYELNITYAATLGEPGDEALGRERFLCSQAEALSLKGIPGVYFHSLMGTPNNRTEAEATGIKRRINRLKYQRNDLEALLNRDGPQQQIFQRYQQLLRRRANQPAFHPDAEQRIHDMGESFFVIERTSISGNQTIFCVFNFTAEPQTLVNPVSSDLLRSAKKFYDIVSGKTLSSGKKGLTMQPYQAMWLVPRS